MLQEEIIKVGKYNVNYLKVGRGAHCVLCLPGTLGSIWTDFKPQIEGFDREKFSLIVWDAPGYGKSRPPEREFHTDFYGQDVDTAFEFMKVLNIPKFSLMGWCYGGVTAILLAAKYPEAVHKLVVWGARSVVSQEVMEICNNCKDLSTWPEKMRETKTELYGIQRLSKMWAYVVDAMEHVFNTNDGKVLSSELLKKVSCPTFILHGEKDTLIDKTNVYFIHSNIQGSRIHLYPEGRHTLHLKYPQDFNQRVQEFLLDD